MTGARRRARLATAVGLAALSVACSEAGATDPTAPTDDLTQVAAPGPLAGARWSDDLLVVGTETLPDRLVARIRAIAVGGRPGVAAIARLSIGQVPMEGKVFDLAAVDPARFRRFTGADAGFTALWERVAAGEVAVPHALRRRLPLDDGHLPVGTGEETLRLHVGAYATHQVGTIDGVVNRPWGEILGMPADNALLISTGLASPAAVRDAIEEIAPDLSISALDIVAETGIDVDTVQRVSVVGSFADAVGSFSYTTTGGGRVAPDPGWVRSHIVSEAVPILGTVTCNRHLMPQLRAALTEIQAAGLADEIHPGEFAGCYYPRFIAGTTTLSNHAFGLALDLNVPGNQRGTVGEMDRGVVAIFERWGFAWGGDWRYTDPMHFELERIVDPG